MAPSILVVDDDPCMRELLALHLTSAGYRVRVAEDAVVAGRMLLHAIPDLLLVDVEMPYMNGIEFVTALRSDATLPRIPVIFLTSWEGLEEEATTLRAGYLHKPCRADTLLAMVARRLPDLPVPVPPPPQPAWSARYA